jgi:hypothetical protein
MSEIWQSPVAARFFSGHPLSHSLTAVTGRLLYIDVEEITGSGTVTCHLSLLRDYWRRGSESNDVFTDYQP